MSSSSSSSSRSSLLLLPLLLLLLQLETLLLLPAQLLLLLRQLFMAAVAAAPHWCLRRLFPVLLLWVLLWRLAAPRHTEHNRCCAPSRGILPVLQQNKRTRLTPGKDGILQEPVLWIRILAQFRSGSKVKISI